MTDDTKRETGWTPEPWAVVPANKAMHEWIVGDHEGGSIADCAPIWMSEKTATANCNLISAAPELYEAVEKCFKLIDDMMPGVRHIALPDYALLNEAPIAARAALAKARGEQ